VSFKKRTVVAAVAGILFLGCVSRRVVPSPGHSADWGVEVTWHGHSCFSFRDANGRVVVIDPFDETVGYRPLKLYADAVLITHNHFDHNNIQAVFPFGRSSLKIVDSTGTVRSAGFDFQALQADHDDQGGEINGRTLLMVWRMGGLKIAHLGDLGQKQLTAEQREALQGVDLLFIPVGGVVTLDAPGAAEIVREIAPRAVFPMHYGRPEVRFYPLDPVDPFLALFPPDQVHRLSGATVRISRKDLTDKTVIYVPGSFVSTNVPNQ
jgi:L-ascorbate metabolism protein UlaG (beta-lactamase superfamily)